MTPLGLVVDLISLLFTWALPIVLIIKWRWLGVVLGFLLVWFTPLVRAELLTMVEPEYETGILQAAWLVGGWLPAVIYCGVILGVVVLVKRLKRVKQAASRESLC